MVARQRPQLDVLHQPWLDRRRAIAAALALVALALVALIIHDLFFAPAPTASVRTALVQRGSVRQAVSGTGTVVPAQQQNLGFRVSGILNEVDVKVGDQVKAGQVLARVDPTPYQSALQQAQAQLQQAQAQLNATLSGNALIQAQHQLAAAQQAYNDTVGQASLTAQQDANQVSLAQQQYNAAVGQYDADSCQPQPPQPYPTTPPHSNKTPDPCPQDQQAVNTAFFSWQSAQAKQAADQLSGQRSVNQAAAAVTQAQDQLSAQSVARPATIAQQQAAVVSAQIQVQTAQQNLGYTTLTAPFDGMVAAVNGEPGDPVTATAAATALAPGSVAPQAAAGGATTGSSQASAGSGGAGGSGGAFLVLSNLSSMQVVVPLAEADAARAQAGQSATVTFDAVPGLSLPSHVLAVAPSSTVISNVVNYYVTLVLDQLDPRLKAGMTANVSVVVAQASNVLVVPNSAITRLGNITFVTVLSRDGRTQQRVPVQTGTVGDTSTEIVSGLQEGQRVMLPQLRLPSGAATAGGQRGPAGGLRLGG